MRLTDAGQPSLWVGPMRHGSMCLHLLGRLELLVDGVPVDLPESAQRLLVFLALHDRSQRRAVVAGNLWPDKPEHRAAANLRSALWRARLPGGALLVAARGPLLGLVDDLAVDARDMEARGWDLLEGQVPSDLSRQARELFVHDLLPGWYDDWVISERDRLGQLRLHFLEAFIDRLVSEERFVEALDTALRLLGADPLRERSYHALARVYQAEGSFNRARSYASAGSEGDEQETLLSIAAGASVQAR